MRVADARFGAILAKASVLPAPRGPDLAVVEREGAPMMGERMLREGARLVGGDGFGRPRQWPRAMALGRPRLSTTVLHIESMAGCV